MKSKLIFVFILDICAAQWKSCSDDKQAQSKEEIKQCFSDNASLDPCIDYECNKNSVCSSSNLNDDVACLIDFCQRKCKSKEKPCVIECLNLDSCSESETEEEYLDCIRNSTVNSQFKSCFDDQERQSKEGIKQCFLENASLDPCINYDCNDAAVCKSSNLNDDVACLVNSCQKKCKSKEKSCVIKCLNLDSCSKSKTEAEYMDCIRNSAADYCASFDVECKRQRCLRKGKSEQECYMEAIGVTMPDIPWPKTSRNGRGPDDYNRRYPANPPRDSLTTADPFGEVTKKKDSDWWAISIIIITIVVILLVIAWPMFTAFRMSNRGNASSHTPVIDPQNIPKGAYPVQNMPITVSAQGSQQSLGQGVTPYPSENQFEPQSEGTKRGKLPELPQQKRMKSKL